MFTERHRYILKLLIYLANQTQQDYETMASLCEKLTIPRGYLNRVIPELVGLGYLESKTGRGGGVRLVQDPEDISMLTVLNETEAMVHREEEGRESCCVPEQFEHCIIDLWMDDFKQDVLGDMTLAEACERSLGNRVRPSLLSSEAH